MDMSEPPKGGYRKGKLKDGIKYPTTGINQGPRASDEGGDTSFRRSNGHVKASKGTGMNKNAYK